MPASRILKIVQETGQNSSAVSTCQFLLPGTTLYVQDMELVPRAHSSTAAAAAKANAVDNAAAK